MDRIIRLAINMVMRKGMQRLSKGQSADPNSQKLARNIGRSTKLLRKIRRF